MQRQISARRSKYSSSNWRGTTTSMHSRSMSCTLSAMRRLSWTTRGTSRATARETLSSTLESTKARATLTHPDYVRWMLASTFPEATEAVLRRLLDANDGVPDTDAF